MFIEFHEDYFIDPREIVFYGRDTETSRSWFRKKHKRQIAVIFKGAKDIIRFAFKNRDEREKAYFILKEEMEDLVKKGAI